MDESIFSTYRQGENRVTASILAVLRSLVLPRIEFILEALLGEDVTLVSFQNQSSKGGRGVPDAEITARARILLETKTERNAVKKDQLDRHLERLGAETDGRVLVLTPDQTKPDVIDEINDHRLVWAKFADLDEAINKLLSDEVEVVSEREEFLLRELQKMLKADNLLRPARDVVAVAARIAWPEYQKYHSYLCQPNRAFQQVKYLAFYSDGRIQATVPAILRFEKEVLVQRGRNEGLLGNLVDRILDDGNEFRRSTAMVFLLTAPDDPQTIKLDQPVVNDLRGAFVQGQRYITLSALRKAKKTSDLNEKTE